MGIIKINKNIYLFIDEDNYELLHGKGGIKSNNIKDIRKELEKEYDKDIRKIEGKLFEKKKEKEYTISKLKSLEEVEG